MSELHDLLEREAAGYQPPRDLLERVHERGRRRERTRRVGAGMATMLLVVVVVGGLSRLPTPPDVVFESPPDPLVDTWVSVDGDGSSQTMDVRAVDGGGYEVVLHDDAASVCSGAPATLTGTGRLDDGALVLPAPVLVCDDGTTPVAMDGRPMEEVLDAFTFMYDADTDTLTDSVGIRWWRQSATPGPDVSEPTASGLLWPQTSIAEVREAQQRADAGDPDYTWQLDAELAAYEEPWEAEIFARFIEEELGWEEFAGASFAGFMHGDQGRGRYESVLFIRCAPGQTNPLSSLYEEAPPVIRGCAPTIDELTYETVAISVTQPERGGPSGIWVVDRWEILQSRSDPGFLYELLGPDYLNVIQVVQVAPPSDAEVTALLRAFLRARVDGSGAEQHLFREPLGSPFTDKEVPLLYATTTGVPYERSEIERVRGPVWPNGWMEYKVRLLAADETVVEQYFHVVRRDGQLGLLYGYSENALPTTENGQNVAVTYSFLDGEVIVAAAPPWYGESEHPTVMRFGGGREHIVIAADPLPVDARCENRPATADAEALARSIMADPDFETTQTGPVRIAGVDGLQIDGVAHAEWDTNWSVCYPMWTTNAQLFRIRLYLIDYPGESARVLTIAVIALEAEFERVLAAAEPVIASLELQTDPMTRGSSPSVRDRRAPGEQ